MPTGVYVRNPKLRPQTFANCKICGLRFGPVQRLATKFCSMECKVKSQTGKTNGKKGKKYPELQRSRVGQCLTCGNQYRAIADYGDRKQVYCSHRCYLKNRRVSFFENAVFDYLEFCGVAIERSVKVGKWTFDGRVANEKVLIEADGTFWHSSDVVKERDARKDKWCIENGFELIRIDEMKFRASPELACDVIVKRWENLTGKVAVRNG